MAKIGRNAPCSCGSGKKYKRCCLLRDQPTPAPYTVQERQSALIKTSVFFEQPRWREVVESLADDFDADLDLDAGLDLLSEDERAHLDEISGQVLDFWAWFDADMGDGTRLVDELLDSGVRLTVGERRFLTTMKRSAMELFEVIDVRPGNAITLRALLDGREVTVRERTASRSVHRWDLLATRVIPCGASGQPEMDGGVLPIKLVHKDSLLAYLREELQDFKRRFPSCPALEFHKTMAPQFFAVWRKPLAPPRMVNYDGDELLFTEVFFDVVDREVLIGALDTSEELERDVVSETRWSWSGIASQREEPVLIGVVSLDGERLRFTANSAERGDRGRQLITALAGDVVVYRTTTTQDPVSAAAGSPGQDVASMIPPDEDGRLREAAEEHLSAYYESWLDDAIPRLGGKTPRQAARTRKLRPELVEMLKELERMYERSLENDEPAFDPTWMWRELALSRDDDESERRHPPRLGHESMTALIDGLEEQARQTVERIRRDEGYALDRTIRRDELLRDLGFQRFVRAHAREAVARYADPESAVTEAELLATHLAILCNFELHLRKIFWVDDALSWMLGATRLDITGEALRLPFGCFAIAFSDRYALGLAERMLARDPTCRVRGRILKVVTAYVMRLDDVPGEGTGLRIALMCDLLDDDWPFLLVRDLWVKPDMRLDEMLDSHFPGVDADELDPIYSCRPLRHLLRLIINSILYATSQDADRETREPPLREPRREGPETTPLCSESVYFLPGTIDISSVRELQRARRGVSDREQVHRCMVRGHWRRPNKDWKDQRARWIKPYWRGPSAATIVERQYRLQP